MSTSAVVVIVIVVALAVAAGIALVTASRRARLRGRFGSEYDRVLQRSGSRRDAEQELARRQERHAQLELRPLSDESRESFEAEWSRVQERFVDSPTDAVAEADRLVTAVLTEIGYPAEGFERQAADMSVRHGDVVESYRRAHDVLVDQPEQPEPDQTTVDDAGFGPSTEDLRDALLGYRSVFESLIGHTHTVSHA